MDRFVAVGYVQCPENRRQMGFHGFLRNRQPVGDFLVRRVARNELQDVTLALGQRRQSIGALWFGGVSVRHERRYIDLAAKHEAHGGKQCRRLCRLCDIAERSVRNRTANIGFVFRGREHDDRNGFMTRPKNLEGAHPRYTWHREVQQHQIEVRVLGGDCKSNAQIGGMEDRRLAQLLAKYGGDAFAYDGMIIDDQELQHRQILRGGSQVSKSRSSRKTLELKS